jgi:hypothetical protein
MLDIDRLSPEEMKLFNDLLDEVLKDPSCTVPLTVMARRFLTALDAGVRDAGTMRLIILGAGTSPGGFGLPPAMRGS